MRLLPRFVLPVLVALAAPCLVACDGILGISTLPATVGGPGGSDAGTAADAGDGSTGNLGIAITAQSVQKVDLLFMIDNSVSMGDKQNLLALAAPKLVQRLTQPNCLGPTGAIVGTSDPNGVCPAGARAEFQPVHDLHLGIVTSSLGSRGGDVCPDSATNPANPALNAHNNDNGELINRAGVAGQPTVENSLADAPSPGNFLAYFPPVAANAGHTPPATPVTTDVQLISDFTSLVVGVHEHGCGFEAQNEAWYRFLVQPDPFQAVDVVNSKATFSGIDATVIAQRADFLRPDSLVAVVVVTDENEEADDPLSIAGQGWTFNKLSFPGSQSGGGAPEGTVACQQLDPNNPATTGPNSPLCESCAFVSPSDPSFAAQCPKNGTNGNAGFLDPANDSPNLRFFHQKERFGLFAGYPTSRYVRGLQKATVPSVGLAFPGDTDHEHDAMGNYIGDQDSQANCVNPLFATDLPSSPGGDLCHLAQGPRTPDMIYYAAIAGVPHELLQATPGGTGPGETDLAGNPLCPAGTPAQQCPQKTALQPADWKLIMGNDFEHYDFSGADFHMVESIGPRTTNTGNWANTATCTPPAAGPPPLPGAVGADPVNGCEFNTNNSDLQFACVFQLVQVDANDIIEPFVKDCTAAEYGGACDCSVNALDKGSQLCSPTTPTNQLYGKAYPSLREMKIASALGAQGAVSSLCPITLDLGQPLSVAQADPLFGYNPAVDTIVEHLKTTLAPGCLAAPLPGDNVQGTPCTMLVTLPIPIPGACTNPGSACNPAQGLFGPGTPLLSQETLDAFCAAKEQAYLAGHGVPNGPSDPANLPVCALQQLTQQSEPTSFIGSQCAGSTVPGWCYVSGAPAVALGCPQVTEFTVGSPPAGATANLLCSGM
jgi:hypothetical protein